MAQWTKVPVPSRIPLRIYYPRLSAHFTNIPEKLDNNIGFL